MKTEDIKIWQHRLPSKQPHEPALWREESKARQEETDELRAALKERDAKLAALEGQEPIAEVDEDDNGLFVDLETPNGTVVKFGQKLYAAAGAAPVPSELVLTFNFGTLVKVVFQDRVLYEVDLSPKPYFQVCWAHGWAGDYESEEEAREECLSLCGHGRSIREIKPGDDGYKNPHQPQLTEKRFLLAAAGAAPPNVLMNQFINDKVELQHKLDDALAKLAAGAAPVPCVVLTPEERAAFERFHETWEDNEGYDVPKEMMRRLAEVGVVHHITAGCYDITKFGHYVLAAGAASEWNDFVEIACARIKSADDAAADGDYMLDSSDCIKVLRGTWGGNYLNDHPVLPAAGVAPVPEGWQLVPEEPTQEMLDAADHGRYSGGLWAQYRNMLAAAPKEPK